MTGTWLCALPLLVLWTGALYIIARVRDVSPCRSVLSPEGWERKEAERFLEGRVRERDKRETRGMMRGKKRAPVPSGPSDAPVLSHLSPNSAF